MRPRGTLALQGGEEVRLWEIGHAVYRIYTLGKGSN